MQNETKITQAEAFFMQQNWKSLKNEKHLEYFL